MTYFSLWQLLCCFHGSALPIDPQNSPKLWFGLLFWKGLLGFPRGCEGAIPPLEIWSVISQDDLFTLYAIRLATTSYFIGFLTLSR